MPAFPDRFTGAVTDRSVPDATAMLPTAETPATESMAFTVL